MNDVSGGDVGRLYVWGLQFNNQYATGVALNGTPAIPAKTTLFQNYPNPFNPSTTIKYELSKSTDVMLTVFDMLGRKVMVLMSAGIHEARFDASHLSSGVYLYRLQARDFVCTKQMLVLRLLREKWREPGRR